MSLAADLAFAVDLARRAADLALERYRLVERLTKGEAAEAVTESDRACQRLIRDAIAERCPDDGFIGEENDDGSAITHVPPRRGTRTWVIDPIDGTNNYVAGLGAWAVCIGLLEDGHPVLGVVLDATRGETYAGARGCGVTVDGRPVRALATAPDARSLVMLTANLLNRRRELPGFVLRWLTGLELKLRILGSSELEAAQVAAGTAHAAITVNGKLWDVVAAAALVIEAGGLLTDLRGRPLFPFDLTGYRGAKVPFLAAAPGAQARFLSDIARDGDWLEGV